MGIMHVYVGRPRLERVRGANRHAETVQLQEEMANSKLVK